MDFLYQTTTRVVSWLREMTASARMSLVVVTLLFVAGATLLIRDSESTTEHYLLGGRSFQAAELARIETAFSTAGLNDYVIRGNRICIPLGKRNQYLVALDRSNALPAEISDVFDEIANNASWLESSEQRKLKIQAGLERQAAQLFSEMAGIERAVVKFGEMDHGAFARRSKRSATVALRMDAGTELEMPQVHAIQDSLTGFGVDSENVAVFDLAGRVTYLGREHAGPSETGNRIYTAAQALHEKRLAARIRKMLSRYPGVQVGVHVQLRSDGAPQTVVVDGQRQVTERSRLTRLETESGHDTVSDGPVHQTLRVTRSDPQIADELQGAGLRWVPDRVTASISLPRSYFQRRWQHDAHIDGGERQAGKRQATARELQRVMEATTAEISSRVANLLPPCANPADRLSQVDVGMHPDPDTGQLTRDERVAWYSASWVQPATWGSVGILALLTLVAVWHWDGIREWAFARTVEPKSREKLPITQAEDFVNSFEDAGGTARVVRELETRIHSDRDAAVRVLRNWVESAA